MIASDLQQSKSCSVVLGKRTGKMFDVGNEFEMKESSAVWAVSTFNNVEPGKLYAVHMVWCKPHSLTDQKEMYRKYAEVRVEEDPEGGYIAHIDWKNALELSYLKHQTQKSATPSFYLKSKFNTSLKKSRAPGDYSMIVYLHREQITESWFHLDGPLPPTAEEKEEMDGAT